MKLCVVYIKIRATSSCGAVALVVSHLMPSNGDFPEILLRIDRKENDHFQKIVNRLIRS